MNVVSYVFKFSITSQSDAIKCSAIVRMVARLSQYRSARKDVSSLQRHILISLSIRDIHKAGDSGFSKSQPAACWQSISASRAFPDAVGPPAAVLADRSCALEPDPPRSIPLWQDLPPPKKAPASNVVLKDGLPSVTSAHEVDRPRYDNTLKERLLNTITGRCQGRGSTSHA